MAGEPVSGGSSTSGEQGTATGATTLPGEAAQAARDAAEASSRGQEVGPTPGIPEQEGLVADSQATGITASQATEFSDLLRQFREVLDTASQRRARTAAGDSGERAGGESEDSEGQEQGRHGLARGLYQDRATGGEDPFPPGLRRQGRQLEQPSGSNGQHGDREGYGPSSAGSESDSGREYGDGASPARSGGPRGQRSPLRPPERLDRSPGRERHKWYKPIPSQELPVFPGRSLSEQIAFFAKLRDVKHLFRCSGSLVVQSVVRKFEKTPYNWWQTHGRDIYFAHKQPPESMRSLDAFQVTIEREFADPHGAEIARAKLFMLEQGKKHTVSQYKSYFDNICCLLPPEDKTNPKQLLASFRRGLLPQLRPFMPLGEYSSVDECFQLALEAEKALLESTCRTQVVYYGNGRQRELRLGDVAGAIPGGGRRGTPRRPKRGDADADLARAEAMEQQGAAGSSSNGDVHEQGLAQTSASRAPSGGGRGQGRGQGRSQGRGRGFNKAHVECWTCGKRGHYSDECKAGRTGADTSAADRSFRGRA